MRHSASRGLALALITLSLLAPLARGATTGRWDNCPAALNAFASEKTGFDFDFPWVGVRKGARDVYGWTRLTFPSFDPILLRAGLFPGEIEEIKGWMRLLRVEGVDAREMLPDEPQVLTSYALATFMRLSHEDPAFGVYAAMVPDAIADTFPMETQAQYEVAHGNFTFADEATVLGLPRVTVRGFELVRPVQAVLLRHLRSGSSRERKAEWLADLMAAMQRRSDYTLLSTVFMRNLHLELPWVAERIGKLPDGRVALASPSWPLVIETRAELVRAWTLHRILGHDWDEAFHRSLDRAVENVRAAVGSERLAPYLNGENNVYWDHTMAFLHGIRGVR